MKVDTICT